MNTKSKIALAAVLFAAIASPSFAGDQDLATLEATSGRIAAQVVVPAGTYASAHGWAQHRGSTAMTRDFQLQGKE